MSVWWMTWRRIPAAWRLFLILQLLYLVTASGRLRVADEQEVYYQVANLVQRGSLAVPQAVEAGTFFGRHGLDGQPYAPYGPATAYFCIPWHLVGLATAKGVPVGDTHRIFISSSVTTFTTSTAGALACMMFFLIVHSVTRDERRAFRWSLVLGCGTCLWSYSTHFYSEAVITALLVGSVAAVARQGTVTRGRVLLSGGLLFFAILCKAPVLVFTPGVILVILGWVPRADRIRYAALMASAVIYGLIFHVWWNIVRFDAPFEFGYNWSETISGDPEAFGESFLRGFLGLTISPGKGLLFFATPALLSCTRWRRFQGRHRLLAIGVALAFLPALLFYAKYMFWEGGYCVGPRHLVPLIPFLLLPAACMPAGQGAGHNRRWIGVALAAVVAFQFLLVQVSFLDDQRIGPDRAGNTYYEWIDERVGLPKNRYRLDYTPQLSYVRRLLVAGDERREAPGALPLVDHWYILMAHEL